MVESTLQSSRTSSTLCCYTFEQPSNTRMHASFCSWTMLLSIVTQELARLSSTWKRSWCSTRSTRLTWTLLNGSSKQWRVRSIKAIHLLCKHSLQSHSCRDLLISTITSFIKEYPQDSVRRLWLQPIYEWIKAISGSTFALELALVWERCDRGPCTIPRGEFRLVPTPGRLRFVPTPGKQSYLPSFFTKKAWLPQLESAFKLHRQAVDDLSS
jgi:hypothetical protein